MPSKSPALNVSRLSEAARASWDAEVAAQPGLRFETLWPEHPLRNSLLGNERACRARELVKNGIIGALDFPSRSSVRLLKWTEVADIVRQGFMAGSGFGLRTACGNCPEQLQMPDCPNVSQAFREKKPDLGHSARVTALDVRRLALAAATQCQQDRWPIVELYNAYTVQALLRRQIPKSLGIFRRAIGHLAEAGMARIGQRDTVVLQGMRTPRPALGSVAPGPA